MAKFTHYPITPNTKPRATRSDKWNKRPCILRYRRYADEVRRLGVEVPVACHHLVFVLPMPKSWSKKKKGAHLHQPHQATPDRDNMDKALLDAVFKHASGGDQHIWDGRITKIWGVTGALLVGSIEPPPLAEIAECLRLAGHEA